MMRIKSYMYVFMYLRYLQDMNLYADISGRTLPVAKTDKPDLYQVRHKKYLKIHAVFRIRSTCIGYKTAFTQYL